MHKHQTLCCHITTIDLLKKWHQEALTSQKACILRHDVRKSNLVKLSLFMKCSHSGELEVSCHSFLTPVMDGGESACW